MGQSKKKLIIGGITLMLLIAIIVVIVVVTNRSEPIENTPTKAKAARYAKAGIATDSTICSDEGSKILQKGGSAVDAAVASTFCLGVANPFSCGIGGGGFMVFFENSTKKFFVYDYREEAPAAAHKKMYINKSSTIGALASGIPGEVKGMWAAHKTHGKLPWKELIQPAIKLAEEGIPIIKPLANAIQSVKKKMEKIQQEMPADIKKLLTNSEGEYLKEGELFVNKQLGNTLRAIANDGVETFYEGEVAQNMTRDVLNNGGILTMSDMKNYTVKKRDVLQLKLNNEYTVNTMPLPGGGPIVSMIHNILSGYSFKDFDINNIDNALEFWQKLIESMKFSYAQRGLLGDPDYLPKSNITRVMDLIKDLQIGEKIRKNKIKLDKTFKPDYYGGAWGKDDFGTSHTSIIAENGDALGMTNTINTYFGSLFLSASTGIIMNNEMDDFSTPGKSNSFGYPPSPANFITPGKRPLSSMSPTIITDKSGNVRMVVGASGGSTIISGTSTIIAKHLYLNMELGESVTSYRFHHQGIPNIAHYNTNIPPSEELIEKLRKIGHDVKGRTSDCVTQAVARLDGYVYAMSDPRKSAEASGY